jgi:hypothetical protein
VALTTDASSPATTLVGLTVAANTATVVAPPDSPLYLALWSADSAGGTGPATPTIATSPSLTAAIDVRDYRDSGSPVEDSQTAIGHAVGTGPQVGTSVTVTNQAASGSRDSALRVLVFTGHDPTTPIGATSHGRQGSGTSLSASLTCTANGSQVFMTLSDWAQTDPFGWAVADGQEIIDSGLTAGITYGFFQHPSADGVAGVAASFNLSGMVSGGQWHWCIVEVCPDPAAIAALSDGTSPLLDPGQPAF